MAGTINYLYDANQEVFVIADCVDPNNSGNTQVEAVRQGKVVRVRVEVLITATKLVYDVQIANQPGTTELTEDDIFTDLAAALIGYQARLA